MVVHIDPYCSVLHHLRKLACITQPPFLRVEIPDYHLNCTGLLPRKFGILPHHFHVAIECLLANHEGCNFFRYAASIEGCDLQCDPKKCN